MTTNNFEFRPALISMVQQSPFDDMAMEDSNSQLSVFLKVCGTLKINGASKDAIRIRLFPCSLRDKAKARLHFLLLGSITTLDKLIKAFLAKFFPPSKATSLRNQITSFTQWNDESPYKAWERFKDLLTLCPIMVFKNR